MGSISHPSDECANLEGVQVRGLRPSLGLVHLGALAAESSGVVLIRPCVPRASSYLDESPGKVFESFRGLGRKKEPS